MRDLHVRLLALVLIAFAVGLMYVKVTRLGLPILPSDDIEVWSVEASLNFKSAKGPIKANLSLPNQPPGYVIADENFVSGKYGLSIQAEKESRQAEWAVRKAKGEQILYYHLQLARDESVEEGTPNKSKAPPFPEVPEYPEVIETAVTAILDDVREKSADVLTFARELLTQMNSKSPNENVELLLSEAKTAKKRIRLMQLILAGARIPTRPIYVLELRDGVRHGQLTPWLQVHNGQEWITFNPENAEQGLPSNVLVWKVGDKPVYTVEGGRSSQLEFSISRHTQEPLLIAEQRARKMDSSIMEFSLFSLPIQTQNVYKILLMVPLGAFLIVFLRNVIGIKTFGTFMPILIALAFRETELMWGVVLFSLIVALGLLLRFYLEYLQLLLVPRLASVLIIVIILMTMLSIFSHKLGFDRGLSIALFPMVILAMTIERMSLVWEEHGPSEAMQQGIGSLIVASMGFLVMSNPILNHLTFVFPETLLILLAMTLLLGRYTGYRVTELWRFRNALKDPEA